MSLNNLSGHVDNMFSIVDKVSKVDKKVRAVRATPKLKRQSAMSFQKKSRGKCCISFWAVGVETKCRLKLCYRGGVEKQK